jgi:tRNA-specific 2-thiouridylase
VAEEMGFPHYVLDYENTFREAVIDEFADSYLAGATPVPCIRCNERVKFRDLLETARDLDADCMATGHYIQRKMGAAKAKLHCAADAARDQSYFLFSTTQEQLDFLRFPLGHLASKAETRALAAKYGLSVADKPDSQDICFVPNGDYAAVIEKLRPGAADPGRDRRHGRATSWAASRRDPLHDRPAPGPRHRRACRSALRGETRPDTRRVIVGPKDALSTRRSRCARSTGWATRPFDSRPEWHVAVKIRSTRPPRDAMLRPLSATEAEVELIAAEEGVSPGQACVFYAPNDSRVLGGGWIHRG